MAAEVRMAALVTKQSSHFMAIAPMSAPGDFILVSRMPFHKAMPQAYANSC